MTNNIRVGIGYDAHPMVPGRKLVLGGVEIPFEKGPEGWSDGDVLTHAVIDALLGAAALGDIGKHFPSEPQYKGISSLELLKKVMKILENGHYHIVNVDATVTAERPQLSAYTNEMRNRLGTVLGVEQGRVSVKAVTAKHMGFVGREEGIAVNAIALIESI